MVAGSNGVGAHVRHSLGPYLLGALVDDERQAVQRHLARCLRCGAEADELARVVEALALLPEQEARALLGEAPAAPAPPGS